jgi:non-specific serine/threonine protein kinase/serine/threonine-protein kinase
MTRERWQRLRDLFEAALAQEPAAQAGFLAGAAPDDPNLAAEVLRLLASDAKAGAFLSTPPGLASDQDFTVSVGRYVGPYRILAQIAQGGMGAVYRAVRDDDQYQKQVAIKLVRGGLGSDLVVERFKSERQILANLEHPNIARLIDGGATEEGWPYFSMEYVEGRPIDAYCASRALSTRQRLELFRTVCSAVQYAHQSLVIHRDLKPSNIVVTDDGTPKLLDFGIAKLLGAQAAQGRTLTGSRLMTPEYASPEQVRGQLITTASDVYSLGVLLYELLAGTRPCEIRGGSPEEILRAICETEPELPSAAARRRALPAKRARELEGDLDTILLKALRKEPGRRYGSPQELAEDILLHLEGLPVKARKDTVRYRAGKFVRRHRTAVAAAGLIVASLATGTAVAVHQARVARAERARAERRFNDVRRLANSFLFEFHDAIETLPGSTKARGLVVTSAQQYLDDLADEAAGDASLQRELATAYEKLSDIQGGANASLGDTKGGVENLQRAVKIREALVAEGSDPANSPGQLASALNRLGNLRNYRGEYAASMEHLQKAMRIREALVEREPGNIKWLKALALSHDAIGSVLANQGDVRGACPHRRSELQLFEKVAAADPKAPNAQRNLALGSKYLGGCLDWLGERTEARELFRKALALDAARAEAEPANAEARLDVSFDHGSLGSSFAKTGEFQLALESYQKALALREEASSADPADAWARTALAQGHENISEVHFMAGDPARALESELAASRLFEALSRADPTNTSRRAQLASSYSGLGKTEVALAEARAPAASQRGAHWRAARSWYERSENLFAELRKAGATLPDVSVDDAEKNARQIARCDAALAAGR